MNLFKRIDNYLLHYFPNIWITRIHQFLPIGLLIIAGIFFANVFVIGYDLKDDISYGESGIFILIIPVLVYLVFWFVIQSRYNVEKSGGRLSILYEYMNYFIYLLIFTIAFSILFVMPVSNVFKLKKAVSGVQIEKDIMNLNLGNVVVNGANTLEYVDGKYEFHPRDYVYTWRYDLDHNYEGETIRVSKEELIKIVSDYTTSYNKYTHNIITLVPESIIDNNLNNRNVYNDDYSFYGDVSYKLGRLMDAKHESWDKGLFHPTGMKIIFGILALLALMVWIFKQIHWKNYLFGVIAIVFTPLIFGILGLIVFEILRLRPEPEEVAMFFIVLYIAFAIKIGLSYLSQTKSNVGVVMGMYLQVFLPLLPFFIWVAFADYSRTSDDELFGGLYWSSWIVGLSSIFIFKYIYRKISLMPAKK